VVRVPAARRSGLQYDLATLWNLGLDEAKAYLAHPVLGARLLECVDTLLALPATLSASDIFGYPDDLKLRSCATLFAIASGPGSPFERLLDRFYDGARDERTVTLLEHG